MIKIYTSYFSASKVKMIPNPIPLTNKYISSLNNKIIISIGRLEYQKGYDNLIKIFKHIHEKYPDWSLHIYGEGNLKTSLVELAEKNNLPVGGIKSVRI